MAVLKVTPLILWHKLQMSKTDLCGKPLPFLSESPLVNALGVNVFAQSPNLYRPEIFSNPYVFPPICLIPKVFRYLNSLELPYTLVVPDVIPRRFWWPLLLSACSSSSLLASKGASGDLPQVQRFFIPAVACPSCAYANDHLFRFCQMCGYKRQSVPRQPALKIKVDPANPSSYSKQESSLRVEFETFLASLPNTKSIYSATPEDVSRFLIWKDRHRKRAGRFGEWNSILGFGNPAASSPVHGYLKAVSEEQLRPHIVPKQAVPFFLTKLLLLARLWDRKMADPAVSPSALFILARDQAFFKTLFFSADRGSDQGCVKTAQIMRFPKDDGFLFNHVWGKTLQDGAYNVFGIRRHSNPQLCPVKAIETYVAVASELRITLSNGYLFRPTNHQGHIVNKPFTSSSTEARLKYYLKDAKIDEGETVHGFRSGSAITLALSGSQLADVMSHVGWSNKGTALYYMTLAEVLREGSPSDLLSSNELAASTSTTLYADLTRLKDFVSAFPRS
ncbi:unnamed protein product [Porites lobata]|uniref:Tyr recombinase domain-containing protein n=1 Tax=Porites lobata TaxID=104759 RepID=A0ABN8NR13_9CNID|nr:unnamed protein product [Porites lobata]